MSQLRLNSNVLGKLDSFLSVLSKRFFRTSLLNFPYTPHLILTEKPIYHFYVNDLEKKKIGLNTFSFYIKRETYIYFKNKFQIPFTSKISYFSYTSLIQLIILDKL